MGGNRIWVFSFNLLLSAGDNAISLLFTYLYYKPVQNTMFNSNVKYLQVQDCWKSSTKRINLSLRKGNRIFGKQNTLSLHRWIIMGNIQKRLETGHINKFFSHPQPKKVTVASVR